jgi:plasmid stabilization system protein ParE
VPAKFLVKITRVAEADLEEIWDFIAHDSPGAADRLLEELDRQVASLERFPERCPMIPENTLMGTAYRHLIYGEYRTIFRASGRTVLVLRVVHGARLLDSSMFASRA